MAQTKRIEWIDLAKGFCIMLVVWWHIKELYSNRGFTDRSILLYSANYFRMPLYFLLSGLFFKTYSGYFEFLRRKVNHLLIPFVVFAILGVAYCLLFPKSLPALRTWQSFYPFVTIWFLLCLFLMNNLFYLIHHLSEGSRVIYICVVLLGVIGFLGGREPFEWLHLYTCLTAMPFFAMGYALRRETNYLYYRAHWWELILAAVAFVVLYLYTYHNGKEGIFYVHNEYNVPIWALYLFGFVGIYGVLSVSRLLGHLPIVSYLGRYSIIVLITHYPLVYLIPKHWSRILFWGFGGWCALEEFFLIICLEVPIIALCNKFLPWIFAQRDVIKARGESR